jgi:hypothetical protein
MALSASACQQFSAFLGSRPYDWQKRIAKDRKPSEFIYTNMYKTEKYPTNFGTQMFHERTYVTAPNDPGMWDIFTAQPCVGTPCQVNRQYISHGVDQNRFDRYKREYQSDVFCLDQLSTIEEGIQKLGQIVDGYKQMPEDISSSFLRTMVLRRAGTQAQGAGLFLAGVANSQGLPVGIDSYDNMFQVSQVAGSAGAGKAGVTNVLFINLNANGAMTALGITNTTLLQAQIGQLTMPYLQNLQEDLAANGYHDREWLIAGKFSITTDAQTRARLLTSNPALSHMYTSADFAKGGSFYSYGVTNGSGDWLFKEDTAQMRFIFRGDLDGKDLNNGSLSGAIWIQQVWPYENVAATYGLKRVFSQLWKNAPIRMYHAYNREARTTYVGDVTNVNPDMKFGMARSFMGQWTWKSPDFFQATDPTSGVLCQYNNDKKNMGYFLGEYDLAMETIYPEIERVILALGEPSQFVRQPNTNTPSFGPLGTGVGPGATEGYQMVLPYSASCYQNVGFNYPPLD